MKKTENNTLGHAHRADQSQHPTTQRPQQKQEPTRTLCMSRKEMMARIHPRAVAVVVAVAFDDVVVVVDVVVDVVVVEVVQ